MAVLDIPRRSPLKDFLAGQQQGARRYDRIAGFFSSFNGGWVARPWKTLRRMRAEGIARLK